MKGIETLEELIRVCDSHLTPEEDQKYLDRAKAELNEAGEEGADALADFILELLSCRSDKIGYALHMAEQVSATPKLIEAVKEVSSVAGANPLTRPPPPQKFQSEIFGGGQIGWTDGTAMWIRQRADEVLQHIALEE